MGRIENGQKRTDDVVALLSLARDAGLDVTLIVAGGGPDEAAMRAHIAEASLDDRVRFLGVLSPMETQRQVYDACDALIVTSSWETGPIVAWEAMSAGVPLLTSAYLGSRAEGALVDGVNCLMFPVGDAPAALEKLRQLMQPQLRRPLVEGGRQLVAQRYTRDASIAQWHAQFAAVLSWPPRERSPAPNLSPSGRLDRLLGVRAGEAVRRLTRRHFAHQEPGGEWPHAYGVDAMRDADFWNEAMRLDVAA